MVITAVVGSAAVGVGASVMGNRSANRAADRAADAQTASSQMGVEENRRQFDFMQELMKPYVQSGNTAMQQQMKMLGLGAGGMAGQKASIDQLQNSPFFQAQLGQGNNAILQNAAATGGLRGGNVQGALAQFAPQLLQQTYQNQLTNVGQLATQGQNAAAGVGAQGVAMGNQNAQLFGNIGQAQAGAALARGQNQQNMIGSISGIMGGLLGGGRF